MNKFLSVVVLFLACKTGAFSQGGKNDFRQRTDSLKALGRNILGGKTDSARVASNEKLLFLMQETLNRPGSFEPSFDSVTNVSSLTSHDNLLKVYTWTLPKVDMSSYTFFGIVQHYSGT